MISDPSPIAAFDQAIALRTVGDGRLTATIHEGWDIRGVPHGGYLLALAAAAARTVSVQQDPLSVAATYLAPPEFGPAELVVEMVRAGRRQSTVAVALRQGGVERVRATLTLGTLSEGDPIPLSDDVAMPDGPMPEAGIDVANRPNQEPLRLHEQVEVRLDPSTGFTSGRPSGVARLDGWLRMVDGREPDALALLLFSDGFPPTIFEARGIEVGHVPTIQLTTHLFAKPRPGWIRAQFRTRVQGGSMVDEDGELWDADGRLVATARQLALLR